MRPVIFWREVVATIRSQRSVSVVTWAAVAALTLTVLLTNGRTEATANQILSSIDSAGTRSVVVTLKEGAGVGTDVLDRLENVAGISWAGAFSAATDSTNIQLGDSATPVSTRTLWTRDFSPLGIADAEGAWASAHTLHQLGMIDGVGTIVDGDGTPHTISGTLETPDFLAGSEPLILLPATPSSQNPQNVSMLVVIADSPQLVDSVSTIVISVLGLEDLSMASMSTSTDLTTLRNLVSAQLSSGGTLTILVVFLLTGMIAGVVLFGLVMLRRKDYGRRRALGASRSLIVSLILAQTLTLAVAGALTGTAIALTIMAASGTPVPSARFCLAAGVLASAAPLIGAIVPGVYASRRDPLRELRVP